MIKLTPNIEMNNTEEKSMSSRYNVGEEIYAMVYINKRNDGTHYVSRRKPLMMGGPMPVDVKFIKLTVKEHHKVFDLYSEQRLESDKKYDGYILEDTKGNIYCNQYPIAQFGQLTDIANRVFTLHTKDFSDRKIRELYKNEADSPFSWIDIDDHLDVIKKGISEVKEETLLNNLKEVFKMINDNFEKTFKGKQIAFKPIFDNIPDLGEKAYVIDKV